MKEYTSIINSYQINDKFCENLINEISCINKEPEWIKSFRLNAFYCLKRMKIPNWGNFFLKKIFFEKYRFYNFHSNDNNYSLKKTLNNLIKKKKAIDFIYNSTSIKTIMKKKLIKKGIIFCSLNEAIQYYPEMVKKYLGRIVKPYDNFFSCLNSSIFSDGTFVYIPKKTICPIELSSYFRINDEIGQFERTLIICDDNSQVSYLEGCTASIKKSQQLHSAVVELFTMNNSIIKYSTVQNWNSGNKYSKHGILNFVTKRALCFGFQSKVIWIQIESGSSITWKYPSCILNGNYSNGEFYSISLSNKYQQIDTGTKMIFLGNNCNAYIDSKNICLNNSLQTYRGLVKILTNSSNSKCYTSCNSMIIGNSCAFTFPINIINNKVCLIEHEASILKITFEQIFCLKKNGFNQFQCYSILINNFCDNILKKMPLEFYSEINDLISNIIKFSLI